jgi:hypothetical protein
LPPRFYHYWQETKDDIRKFIFFLLILTINQLLIFCSDCWVTLTSPLTGRPTQAPGKSYLLFHC